MTAPTIEQIKGEFDTLIEALENTTQRVRDAKQSFCDNYTYAQLEPEYDGIKSDCVQSGTYATDVIGLHHQQSEA